MFFMSGLNDNEPEPNETPASGISTIIFIAVVIFFGVKECGGCDSKTANGAPKPVQEQKLDEKKELTAKKKIETQIPSQLYADYRAHLRKLPKKPSLLPIRRAQLNRRLQFAGR